MRSISTLSLLLIAQTAFARLGETPIQCANRYGAPKDDTASRIHDKNSPLIEGAIHHVYEYQGWRIRIAFLQLDSPAVRMDYQKILGPGVPAKIEEYELKAIMDAQSGPGYTWKSIAYKNPDSPNKGFLAKAAEGDFAGAMGQKMWQRSDGAICWLRSKIIIRVELPAAREYEAKLKAQKEQKARESVPKF